MYAGKSVHFTPKLTCVAKQCQLVTPLQLYFSFKSAFTNAQVSRLEATSVRVMLTGACGSPGVWSRHSSTLDRYLSTLYSTFSSCELLPSISRFRCLIRGSSMRYSRMLEESSFANRKADYFWLLLLSSVMLLVSCAELLLHASHASWRRPCRPCSTSPSSPPRSPSYPYTCGPAVIRPPQSLSLVCSRSQRRTCH